MARRSPRQRSAGRARAQRESRGAILKIGAVVATVFGVGAIYMMVQASHRDLDPVTLCGSDITDVTVLVVDVTDPMNAAQRQDFANQLTRLKNSVPRYGKLVVAKVDAAGDSLLQPVITRCNPGTAADVSEATGDPGAVQKQRDEGFDQPLDRSFEALSKASGAERSPILESIQSVALTELQKPGLERARKRLFVASDLLQNTDDLSFYGKLPAAEQLIASPQFRRARTDLRGVEVELWMLQRADAASTQPIALARLWEALIAAQGGQPGRIYNVSG